MGSMLGRLCNLEGILCREGTIVLAVVAVIRRFASGFRTGETGQT